MFGGWVGNYLMSFGHRSSGDLVDVLGLSFEVYLVLSFIAIVQSR